MRRKKYTNIMGDLPDFVSPIDGTIVHGRAGLREHEKRHGVTGASDFKEEWAKKAKEREKHFIGQDRNPERAREIARALERHERRR